RGVLVPGQLRDARGRGSLLVGALRRRRRRALRMAQGPLRPVVADRADRASAPRRRPGSREGAARLPGDDEDGQARHRRARAGRGRSAGGSAPPARVGASPLFVEDPQRSKAFYERVFGLSTIYEDESAATFKFENPPINLLAYPAAGELIAP